MQTVLLFIYVTIRTWLAHGWLRFCRWINQPQRLIYPTSEFGHKVVVIGDGFSAGLGDSIHVLGHCGGIAYHLQKLVQKSKKVRHQWQILNRGIAFTTSQDWSPHATTGTDADTKKKTKKNLLLNMFSKPEYKDANIVMVLVGSMDAMSSHKQDDQVLEPQDSLRHLSAICTALRKKGKKVCLAPVLCSTSNEKTQSRQQKLNQLIQAYCKSTSFDDIPVIYGPNLNMPAFRKVKSRCFDGIHLNAKGYKLLAENAFDVLEPMLVAEEWTVWKNKLNKIDYDSSLYE